MYLHEFVEVHAVFKVAAGGLHGVDGLDHELVEMSSPAGRIKIRSLHLVLYNAVDVEFRELLEPFPSEVVVLPVLVIVLGVVDALQNPALRPASLDGL